MAKWTLLRKGADFDALGKEFGVDPLIIRLMVNRGIADKQDIDNFLNGGAETFYDARLMKDIELAVDIINDKIADHKKIRVIGDYDADGVCSTSILLKGLKHLGAEVDGIIPHRIKDGYGLNISMVDDAYNDGIDTIITCDNGISAREQVLLAKKYGMTVIITDHHDVPFEEAEAGKERKYMLPEADAVVDPKQVDCDYPFESICGAFVAYKLISLMVRDKGLLDEMLQLAAIATVTDIMPLKYENRALVKMGLRMLPDTSIVGLSALIKVLGLYKAPMTAFHLGFMIGPCINAAGRIGSADKALELLMSDDEAAAMCIAGELKDMNDSRKMLTDEGASKAEALIENSDMKNDKVLVVYLPDTHESVAGIIAGRIKEKYTKPSMVITDAECGLKGSARSIEAYNMYDEMSKIADVFTKFGGHPQAAGFSLSKDRLEELRTRLNNNCMLTSEDFVPKYVIDADTPFSYCTGNIIDQINILEPFGNGNEKPLFARSKVKVINGKALGESGSTGRYTVIDSDGFRAELMLFRRNNDFIEFVKNKYGKDALDNVFAGRGDIAVSFIYYPKWNEYQGRKTIQYIIEDYC